MAPYKEDRELCHCIIIRLQFNVRSKLKLRLFSLTTALAGVLTGYRHRLDRREHTRWQGTSARRSQHEHQGCVSTGLQVTTYSRVSSH